ncbi:MULTISPECIES: PLP-dependent aminotransferase family protein [unclassified Pseudomonas]|uniref:MocR-like pyridoxine biosynthesis transcription factor PdxR n=1 Tax=unclassified Pseudomonas TaxID=196821 RepID=UPI00088DAFD8|nr:MULTISPECIES: PLP-dependent aminotransferase family protein [unclassified Pseudomonas]SCY85680.1 GntR family transcriptional regulator / MocR family aminotransferase [Pseudomonas sp. NFACC37-1]SFO48634.1 GntR family transcriptional regulator / MocR family aminotransferase [Pseudomonas sp. NFACC24-1]
MTASLIGERIQDLLDRRSAVSLQQQLYRHLRIMIEEGTLRPSSRLPSTRSLAAQIGVSRITVVAAFDMLTADGYLVGSIGSGTFVVERPPIRSMVAVSRAVAPDAISLRGQLILSGAAGLQEREGAFLPGVPDVSAFPYAIWQRLQSCYLGQNLAQLSGYANGGGYLPLRRALADYLRVARGVRCSPDQVLVTMGTQQSLDLILRLLTDANDQVCIENPSHWAGALMLKSLGVRSIPVPVDREGIDMRDEHFSMNPKLVFVTPSHQFPLGSILSSSRRERLLRQAAQRNFWIVEDDYDSELRYDQAPSPSLQGEDNSGRVIYLGTFSKVMYPGLRMSYMVVPPSLVNSMVRGLLSLYRPGHLPLQAALADFINDGHLTRHLINVRPLYAARQAELRRCLAETFGEAITLSSGFAGLHLTLRFRRIVDLDALQAEAAKRDVLLRRLSAFNHDVGPFEDGFVLGYGALNQADIGVAVRSLHEAYLSIEKSAPVQADHYRGNGS